MHIYIYIYGRQLDKDYIKQKMLYRSQPGQVVSHHQNYKVTFTTSTRPIQANPNTPMSRTHQGYHQPYLNPQQTTPHENYVNPYGKQYNSTNLNKQLNHVNGSSIHGQFQDEGREQRIKQESDSWLGNNWWKIFLGLIVIGGIGFGAFMLLKGSGKNMGDNSYQVSSNMVEDGKGNLSFIMPPTQNINQTSKTTVINTLEVPSEPGSVKNKTQESKQFPKITNKQEKNKKQQQVKNQKNEVIVTQKNEKIIQNIMPSQSKTGIIWGQNFQVKYEQKTQNKTDRKSEVKSEILPQIKQPKQETKFEITPKDKPAAKTLVKPETIPENKPEIKLEIKTETKRSIMPVVKPETKPEIKSEIKTEIKPEIIPVTKPEDKNELKNQGKIAIKPVNGSFEVKPSETKTQNRPANKSQQIYDTDKLKPIPKMQIRSETRVEEKLQNRTEAKSEINEKRQPMTNITNAKAEQKKEVEQILDPELTQNIKTESKMPVRLSIKEGEQIRIQSQPTNAQMADKQKEKEKEKQKMINEEKGIKNKSHKLRKYQ